MITNASSRIRVLIFGLAALMMSVATAQTVSRSQLGSAFEIKYGTVVSKEKVKIESSAPQGAVVGGIVGGATSGHHHRGKHAVEGAVAGALLTAVLEGNRHARSFVIDLTDGSEIKIITEQRHIREGDCVAVEMGQTANIRVTSPVHCESPNHEALAHPVVHAKSQSEAAACHTAKEQALQATTEEATDIALKKVQVFCDS